MSDDTIDLNINGISHPILCGLCKAPIAFRGEPDIESGEAGCASCGNWNHIQEVVRISSEYAKDEGQLILNRAMREAARGNSFVAFDGQSAHDKSYRFVVGDLQI